MFNPNITPIYLIKIIHSCLDSLGMNPNKQLASQKGGKNSQDLNETFKMIKQFLPMLPGGYI